MVTAVGSSHRQQKGKVQKMADLLRSESDGSISFGDHTLKEKSKVEDFPHAGDLLKCKTYCDITKLEKNGMFLYESVPGTSVENFSEREDGISFTVKGSQDAQITLGMADDTLYEIEINGESTGTVKTNLGGKLSFSVSLGDSSAAVNVIRK